MAAGDEMMHDLEWLAFLAQQFGWQHMAERIADDALESQRRVDELEQRRNQLLSRRRQGAAGDAARDDEAA
ncbi:MAG TPA: hypothetical protein V6D22_22225 [Candidatus Obscuribacterales bacterium]